MNDTLIVLTVGTSLLSNVGYKRERESARDSLRDFNSLCLSINNATLSSRNWRSSVTNYLENFVENYSRELGYRSCATGIEADRLPQELSYLFALRNQEPDIRADILLLSSDTIQGKLCTAIIYDIITNHLSDHYTLTNVNANSDYGAIKGAEVIKGLDGKCDCFNTMALPSLTTAIVNHVKDTTPKRVIMNPTGGFKGIIPYCTLVLHAIEAESVELHYLFEDSAKVAKLPCYPVGLEFTRWHREQTLLNVYQSAPDEAAWKDLYFKALDPRMQAVAKEKRRLHSDISSWSLSRLYERQYKKIRTTDPLQLYSERIIDQFLPEHTLTENSRPWKVSLKKLLASVGPLIWQGDKLPMAANHSSEHHHNLLQIAQMFLTPIANENVATRNSQSSNDNGCCFLNNAERIALVCAIMLHDCGHTLDRLPVDASKIVLFRSEIRLYHNYLAYYRLKNGLLQEALGWEPPNSESLWQVIMDLCYHHRKSTGWDGASYKQEYTNEIFAQPCHVELSGVWQDIDYPKLVSILRLIDGCDNQMIRVGGDVGWKIVEKQLQYDYQSWKERLHQMLAMCEHSLQTDDCEACKELFQDTRKHLQNGDKLPALDWQMRADMERKSISSATARIWLELARVYDECAIRDGQYVHFLRHALVDDLSIRPSDDFDLDHLWSFEIRLQVRSSELWTEVNNSMYDRKLTVRQWIEKDVSSEIKTPQIAYLTNASQRSFKLVYNWILPDSTIIPWPSM